MARATVSPSNTIISMTLPDSASIFTTEIWAIIKVASKYSFYKLIFVPPSFTIYEAGTSFDNKDIISFVGYLAILVLEVMKRETLY